MEDEIERLRFFRADCDGLVLRAEFFLPGFDGVGAGREIFQREIAGFRRDVEIGVREDEQVRAHPRMDVTRDGNRQLGFGESRDDRWIADGFGFVPGAIFARHGVNVVDGLVLVVNFEGLVGHDGENARDVHAALLVEDDGRGRNVETVAAEAGFDVDDDIRECSAGASDDDRRDDVDGLACTQAASADMSMGLKTGGAPSSFTVPEIEPAVAGSTTAVGAGGAAGSSDSFLLQPMMTKAMQSDRMRGRVFKRENSFLGNTVV